MRTETYDVVVIGGGAAGLSAALVLGRARRGVAVIDAGAPRNAPAKQMQGFLSRDGMPPGELLRMARDEVRGYGVALIDERVTEITTGLSLQLADGRRIMARRLLFATGAVDQLPDIAGGGAVTSSTARTATAGRYGIRRSASSGPTRDPSSMRISCGNGRATSSSSRTPSPLPAPSGRRWRQEA